MVLEGVQRLVGSLGVVGFGDGTGRGSKVGFGVVLLGAEELKLKKVQRMVVGGWGCVPRGCGLRECY